MILAGDSFSGGERHCAFLNIGEGRMATISKVSGFDLLDDGRAIAASDWDFDGDLDFWMTNRTAPRVRFLRNGYPTENSFLSIRLEGVTANRDAIGSRVQLHTVSARESAEQQIRTLRAGEGFLGQSTKWIHFGIRKGSTIERLVVRWPDGKYEEFTDLKADQFYQIRQGTRQAVVFDRPTRTQRLSPSKVAQPERTARSRVLLTSEVPLPDLPFESSSGQEKDLNEIVTPNQPLLINLFASWCIPCAAELRTFSRHAKTIREAGLEILALSVDGVGRTPGNPDEVQALLKRTGFPFLSGQATEPLLAALQSIHDVLFDARRTIPIPTSILIDGEGQLAALYRGPVELDHLLTDTGSLGLAGHRRMEKAIPFRGRWITPPGQFRLSSIASALLEETELPIAHDYMTRFRERMVDDGAYAGLVYELANRFNEQKLFKHAERFYREATVLDPQFAKAHHALGLKLQEWGNLDEALVSYHRSVAADPNLPKARFILALALLERWGSSRAGEAIEQLQTAIRLEPDYLLAHYYLGLAFEQTGNPSRAARAYRQALRIDPNFQPARARLSSLGGRGPLQP